MIKQFRKKPVVIEAIQWDGTNVFDVYAFIHGKPDIKHDMAREKWDEYVDGMQGKPWLINTLEDGPASQVSHWASVGDFIIKGVQGELYPCKPEIFEATYDEVLP